MLRHLTIKNYALIRHLEFEPSANLSVITGETGAGKSIMLGALGLLMGNRADTKVLWNEEEKCIIEGSFDIGSYRLKTFFKNEDLDYDDVSVVRREISPGGKSRAFINDTPVNLDVLRKLGNLLMDIHSQHETLALGEQSFQLELIDSFAQNTNLREEYVNMWRNYLQAKKAFETLTREADTLREEADFIRFQLDELVKADLKDGEQESLESELKVMEHAEEIKTRFKAVLDILSRSEFNVLRNLSDARNNFQPIRSYAPSYETLFNRLESTRIELEDIANEIEREEENIEFDVERTELVKERLSNIYRLLKKHRLNSLPELLSLQLSLQEKAALTSNLDEALQSTKTAFEQAEANLKVHASKLTQSRQKVFEPLAKQIIKLLKELGIPDAALHIQHSATAPSASGGDNVDLLFSANKGMAPKPLAQVASGGEFSRLMFCIKYVMAEKKAMPTLILDEIDSGISGEIAIKLGNLMSEMSRNHQVITISHLPQIAAKGDSHYFVFKDNSDKKTVSNIRTLSDSERIEEIAKMIGGAKPSKIALENAQELLAK
jgi:DNA repair protein RecN (Recombination protein N)